MYSPTHLPGSHSGTLFSNEYSTSEYIADVPPVMLSGPVITDKDLDRLCNVLKPVPQPPLEPELDLNKASGTKLFWGRPCHVDAQHGPKQEAGVQGGGTAPLVGSGAKPQKPVMICTYYNQLYNGKCYSCTQLSTLHFVINLLEPACDMLARGWPRAGTRN